MSNTIYRKHWKWSAAMQATALAVAVGSARGAPIGAYTFTTSESDVPTAIGVTFLPFTRTVVTANSVAGQFQSTGYTQSATIDTTQYVSFSITTDASHTATLQSLGFDFTRSDKNATKLGPQNGEVRASFESFAAGSGTGSTYSPTTTSQSDTWDFSDFVVPASTTATFRLYGFNATDSSSTDTLAYDNVALNGVVSSTPEPALLGALVPGMLLLRRARRGKMN